MERAALVKLHVLNYIDDVRGVAGSYVQATNPAFQCIIIQFQEAGKPGGHPQGLNWRWLKR